MLERPGTIRQRAGLRSGDAVEKGAGPARPERRSRVPRQRQMQRYQYRHAIRRHVLMEVEAVHMDEIYLKVSERLPYGRPARLAHERGPLLVYSAGHIRDRKQLAAYPGALLRYHKRFMARADKRPVQRQQ